MISIERYRFEGPFYEFSSLRRTRGVYAILDRRPSGTFVLDIGESENVRERVSSHDRQPSWRRNSKGIVVVAVLYLATASDFQRKTIEKELRVAFELVCGIR